MMHNGHVLTPDELAVVNPSDTEVCTVCQQTYFTTAHKATTCFGCYYGAAMDSAGARFKGLADALASRLGVEPSVDQTGGMCMALRIPLGPENYAYFGEAAEATASGIVYCGVYSDALDESGNYQEEAISEYENADLAPPEISSWSDDLEFCERVADWAAPLLKQHVS